jgi:UDP-N-acetylmuramyl pentapeptide phosphotransferase/UDP-N-acetylglucosamine-1-phosphate transferase
MSSIIWLALSLGMSAVGTYGIRALAVRRGLYDHPNHRSSHRVPTPRLGGVAIVIAALAGWAGIAASLDETTPMVLPIVAGGALVALVGLVDDLRPVSPLAKLTCQFVAVMASLGLLQAVAPATPISLTLAAVLWLLTYMNFFNFMDGSDGLAAGVGVLAAMGLALVAWEGDSVATVWMTLVLAASAAGFLAFNFPPASIFMGDSGSLFLGYGLGMAAYGLSARGLSPVASGLVLSPFLFDAGFTLLRRATKGERLWLAHRSHLYQRLIATGANHRQVAVFFYTWTIWGTLLGWGWLTAPEFWRPGIVTCALLPGALLAMLVRGREQRMGPRAQSGSR